MSGFTVECCDRKLPSELFQLVSDDEVYRYHYVHRSKLPCRNCGDVRWEYFAERWDGETNVQQQIPRKHLSRWRLRMVTDLIRRIEVPMKSYKSTQQEILGVGQYTMDIRRSADSCFRHFGKRMKRQGLYENTEDLQTA